MIKTLGYPKFREKGVEFGFSTHYSSDIYIARNATLYDNGKFGNKPIDEILPFNGETDYDYLLWIDSDTQWQPEHIEMLLEWDRDIVSGLVPINASNMTNVGWFKNSGLMRAGANAFTEILPEVDVCGWAFVLVKKGVFEKVSYPWFEAQFFEDEEKNLKVPNSEDIGFCRKLQNEGFKIYADTRVKVRHTKEVSMALQGEENNGAVFQYFGT
jgi:GT2 family glycosyltransferase